MWETFVTKVEQIWDNLVYRNMILVIVAFFSVVGVHEITELITRKTTENVELYELVPSIVSSITIVGLITFAVIRYFRSQKKST